MVRIIIDDSEPKQADACPECGQKLKILVSYDKDWKQNTFRVFTFMCPACSFQNIKKQPIKYWEYRDATDGKPPKQH